jgi:hypothetical protein
MQLPELLIPLLGLLALLSIIKIVEFIVIGVLAALQTCGVLRKDLWVKTLVHDAATFQCGLVELFKGKAAVGHTAKNQFSSAEVPRRSVSKMAQGGRIAAVLVTVTLVVSAQYAVFFVAQRSRTVRRVSDGVEVIAYEGGGELVKRGTRVSCVTIDKRSATENSFNQYVYESCLENTLQVKENVRPVNRDFLFNFSTNEDGFLTYDLESQGRLIFSMVLMDFVTTFDDKRDYVNYTRSLQPFIDSHAKAFGCAPLGSSATILSCGDKTDDEVRKIIANLDVPMKGARIQVVNKLFKYSSGEIGRKKRTDISKSATGYIFVNEANSARGIPLIILSILGVIVISFKIMNVSEEMHIIRSYEAVGGHCASSIFAMQRMPSAHRATDKNIYAP